VIEAAVAAPEPAELPAKASRVWRMVLLVVSVQLVLIAIGMVLFTAMAWRTTHRKLRRSLVMACACGACCGKCCSGSTEKPKTKK